MVNNNKHYQHENNQRCKEQSLKNKQYQEQQKAFQQEHIEKQHQLQNGEIDMEQYEKWLNAARAMETVSNGMKEGGEAVSDVGCAILILVVFLPLILFGLLTMSL